MNTFQKEFIENLKNTLKKYDLLEELKPRFRAGNYTIILEGENWTCDLSELGNGFYTKIEDEIRLQLDKRWEELRGYLNKIRLEETD